MQIYDLDKSYNFLKIDARNSMYPTYGFIVNDMTVFGETDNNWSTFYGYASSHTWLTYGKRRLELEAGEYISIPICNNVLRIETKDVFFGVFRLGFMGQFIVGKVEDNGRLCYIDGCSDSMLVYPPRKGDPSLNALYFPPGIEQSWHTHPSIRMGFVAEGEGTAWFGQRESTSKVSDTYPLKKGNAFLLPEQELHRFSTKDKSMKIIAFHPDGDWGPTDENHAMINRTYIK